MERAIERQNRFAIFFGHGPGFRRLLGLVVSLLVVATASAAPRPINYQGLLTDHFGETVDGPILMTFALYEAESGGTALWSESKTVNVVNGIYDGLLGDTVSLDLPFDQPYFLGITVAGGSEMLPRQPLTAVPSALRAGQAGAVVGNGVTTATIMDGSVHPNQLVTSCTPGEILVMTPTGWGCGPAPR